MRDLLGIAGVTSCEGSRSGHAAVTVANECIAVRGVRIVKGIPDDGSELA